MQWNWVGINLRCNDVNAVLEWATDMKFHVSATKHKANCDDLGRQRGCYCFPMQKLS